MHTVHRSRLLSRLTAVAPTLERAASGSAVRRDHDLYEAPKAPRELPPTRSPLQRRPDWPQLERMLFTQEREDWQAFLRGLQAEGVRFGGQASAHVAEPADSHTDANAARRRVREDWHRAVERIATRQKELNGRAAPGTWVAAAGACAALCSLSCGAGLAGSAVSAVCAGTIGANLVWSLVGKGPDAALVRERAALEESPAALFEQATQAYREGDLVHCRWLLARANGYTPRHDA